MQIVIALLMGMFVVKGILLYLSWKRKLTPRRGAALWASYWGLVCFTAAIWKDISIVSFIIGATWGLTTALTIYVGTSHLVELLLRRK